MGQCVAGANKKDVRGWYSQKYCKHWGNRLTLHCKNPSTEQGRRAQERKTLAGAETLAFAGISVYYNPAEN